MLNIKIEGVPYQVEEGLTILEAAKKCGYEIPSLCSFNHGECSQGSCRVCLVEATGARGLVASCVYPVSEGMEIKISTPKATEARRTSSVTPASMSPDISFKTKDTKQIKERKELKKNNGLKATFKRFFRVLLQRELS